MFSVSRRDFLKASGLLTGGLVLGVSFFSCDDKGKKVATVAPNVYLTVGSDGKVTIVAHRSEMGQGIRTSLPLIIADELGADWTKVEIIQAEGDEKNMATRTRTVPFQYGCFINPCGKPVL
ncbi:molybdopterin-dependent oxidoreductase [Sphingobacterium sp. E70]|uniref:molybdopterin cofactor-binding domain-containing protein n=1 Tax=Sphingobacterium sp. E70 TaxID=2853439 RepID=UPI00211CC477|nr:molybdopterin cofactor-binding domain-containing protein [Sphingobacterium sp. E70]ULT29035.1 molybdopterin-dependent oxidoreductase [Sphingobacterium sp. E70]